MLSLKQLSGDWCRTYWARFHGLCNAGQTRDEYNGPFWTLNRWLYEIFNRIIVLAEWASVSYRSQAQPLKDMARPRWREGNLFPEVTLRGSSEWGVLPAWGESKTVLHSNTCRRRGDVFVTSATSKCGVNGYWARTWVIIPETHPGCANSPRSGLQD